MTGFSSSEREEVEVSDGTRMQTLSANEGGVPLIHSDSLSDSSVSDGEYMLEDVVSPLPSSPPKSKRKVGKKIKKKKKSIRATRHPLYIDDALDSMCGSRIDVLPLNLRS